MKSILNIKGIQTLNKAQQSSVNGGDGVSGSYGCSEPDFQGHRYCTVCGENGCFNFINTGGADE